MASIGGSCSLSKIFKITVVVSCVLLFFQYVLDGQRTETIYTSSTTLKGPLQWPKRTQSRHCFDGVQETNKNGSSNNIATVDSSASPAKEEPRSNEFKDVKFANVHDPAQRIDVNISNAESLKDSKPSDSFNINNISLMGSSHNASQQIFDISDSLKENTVAPPVGCDVPCPPIPPGLIGAIKVNLTELTLKDVENNQLDLAPGGHYAPRHCKPNDKVAVIIPYRDREAHLAIFLNNMHPFLMKQQIEYQIYIVEQKGHGKFNRASLMNIGFTEANRLHDWDCFIFHDVDLLPLDDRNLYTCPSQPRHLSAAIDKFQFKLPYATIFGGVSALTTEQFKKVNGFSNSFWGWGGEDDDMANRINYHNYHISRYPMSVARYTMLRHEKESPNPKRYDILTKGKKLFNTDGLNNLQYTLVETQTHKTYTTFLVELHPPS